MGFMIRRGSCLSYPSEQAVEVEIKITIFRTPHALSGINSRNSVSLAFSGNAKCDSIPYPLGTGPHRVLFFYNKL